jgi:DNA-binding beta-propeller fold protein YncE
MVLQNIIASNLTALQKQIPRGYVISYASKIAMNPSTNMAYRINTFGSTVSVIHDKTNLLVDNITAVGISNMPCYA